LNLVGRVVLIKSALTTLPSMLCYVSSSGNYAVGILGNPQILVEGGGIKLQKVPLNQLQHSEISQRQRKIGNQRSLTHEFGFGSQISMYIDH